MNSSVRKKYPYKNLEYFVPALTEREVLHNEYVESVVKEMNKIAEKPAKVLKRMLTIQAYNDLVVAGKIKE